jgi:hypothetical protein
MRIPITGSKVHRVWRCPASAVLPQITSEDAHRDAMAGRGTKIHAYLERVSLVGRAQALAELGDEETTQLCRAIDVDALPTHLATEVAFAWDWRAMTARELGRNLGRNYGSLGADEIPCTLDLVGTTTTTEGGVRGYVGDYKTGRSKLPPPERNGQLLLGALCVRATYGCDDVVVELLHLHPDGDHHRERHIVDMWDLDSFGHELADAMRKVEHWEAEYAAGRSVGASEGPHCDHCPAFQYCPAKTALVRSIPRTLTAVGVSGELDGDGRMVIAPGTITAANAAELWIALERIEDVVSRAMREMCGIAAVIGDIPLPDGRVLGRVITERRVLDGRIGAEVLEELYGRKVRDEAVELKLSLTAVQQAVARHLKPGEKMTTRDGGGRLDKVIGEIERRGGLAVNTTENIKPHVPRSRRTK